MVRPMPTQRTRIEGFRVSALAHFIACENGWRGTAYVYREGAASACDVLLVPDLCLTREEAQALATQRGLARAQELSQRD